MELSGKKSCPTAILVDLNLTDNSVNKASFNMSDILHLSDMDDVSHCSALSGLGVENLKNDVEESLDVFQSLSSEDEIENEKFDFHFSGLPDLLEDSSNNESKNELADLDKLWNSEIATEANKISRRLSFPHNQLLSKLVPFSPVQSSIAMNASKNSSLSSTKSFDSPPCLSLEFISPNNYEKENDSALANCHPIILQTKKLKSFSIDSDIPVFYSPIEESSCSTPCSTVDDLKIQVEKSRVNEQLGYESVLNNQDITKTNSSSVRKFTYTVESDEPLEKSISEPALNENVKPHCFGRVPPIRKDTYIVKDKPIRHLSGSTTPSRIAKTHITKSKSFNDPSKIKNSVGAKPSGKLSTPSFCKPSTLPASKHSLQTARTKIKNNTHSSIFQNSSRIVGSTEKPRPIKASQNFLALTKSTDLKSYPGTPSSPAKTSTAVTKTKTPKPCFSTPQKIHQTISTPSRRSVLSETSLNPSGAQLSTPTRRSMIPSTTSNQSSNVISTPGRRSMLPMPSSNSRNSQFSTPKKSATSINPSGKPGLLTPTPGRRKSIPFGISASKVKRP